MRATPRLSWRGLVQSTGTVSAAHWKPSPQSDHASVRSNAGSGAQVVVVVVVVDDDEGFVLASAGTASAPSNTSATRAGPPLLVRNLFNAAASRPGRVAPRARHTTL